MEQHETIVDSHRNMLMVSKNLSDFQIENIKKWAFIFFDKVSSCSVTWNFIDKNDLFYEGEVEYDIETQEEDENKIKTSIDYLTYSTRVMFWTDTKVNVKINGKLWKNKKKASSNTKKTSPKKKAKNSKSSSKTDVQV